MSDVAQVPRIHELHGKHHRYHNLKNHKFFFVKSLSCFSYNLVTSCAIFCDFATLVVIKFSPLKTLKLIKRDVVVA